MARGPLNKCPNGRKLLQPTSAFPQSMAPASGTGWPASKRARAEDRRSSLTGKISRTWLMNWRVDVALYLNWLGTLPAATASSSCSKSVRRSQASMVGPAAPRASPCARPKDRRHSPHCKRTGPRGGRCHRHRLDLQAPQWLVSGHLWRGQKLTQAMTQICRI